MFRESIYYNGRMAAKIEVNDNGQFAMNKIVYYLRQAESLSQPAEGDTSDSLSINTAMASNYINIYDENGALKIKIGNDEAQNLTNSQVRLSDLTFSNISVNERQSLVQTSFYLQSINSNFWHDSPAFFQSSIMIGQ